MINRAFPARSLFLFAIFAFAALFGEPVHGQQISDRFAPEIATGNASRAAEKPVKATRWMVSVANPLAASAAADILERGGSAADAAIAAQAVLGLVEPQSSGLGGGAFVLHWDAQSKTLTTLDGRETAPKAADGNLFRFAQGKPMNFFDAVIGGRSVGTPGTPALLDDMHRRWGAMAWSDLFTEAERLARDGFEVSPRLAALVAANERTLSRHAPTASYFLPGGEPIREGALLKNEAYAVTIGTLSSERSKPFYQGDLAANIVETVRGFSQNPGLLALDDLASYTVKEREPVCADFLAHQVCGMGPPSSGGLTVGQILQMLDQTAIADADPSSPQTWRLIADATRLAFADRGRYMADSDFVKMPTDGLLQRSYTNKRAERLGTERALEETPPGEPEWKDGALPRADDAALEMPSTSHLSIVDAKGNIVSMTTTIESGFGSRLMVNGYLLNNELTDFSFLPERDGVPVANRVEGGKRPRSSMAPTIVLKEGKPRLVIGSPGGSRIIPYVANTIIAHLAWGEDIQKAISRPHLVNRFGTYDLEEGTEAVDLESGLKALGYETKIRGLNSGLHGIAITDAGLEGGADPRREGVVIGK